MRSPGKIFTTFTMSFLQDLPDGRVLIFCCVQDLLLQAAESSSLPPRDSRHRWSRAPNVTARLRAGTYKLVSAGRSSLLDTRGLRHHKIIESLPAEHVMPERRLLDYEIRIPSKAIKTSRVLPNGVKFPPSNICCYNCRRQVVR